MKIKILVFLFSIYSYFLNLVYLILELMPPFVRWVFFKFALKRLGRNSLIDYKTYLRYPGKISIGDHVAINRGCELYPSFMVSSGWIKLGSHVTLSPNVKLFAIQHDYSTLSMPDIAGPILIEDFAWIGGGSIVMPGVTIGEGAVVGAGSVVTRDIPPYSVAVGIPARVIKGRVLKSCNDGKVESRFKQDTDN